MTAQLEWRLAVLSVQRCTINNARGHEENGDSLDQGRRRKWGFSR